MGDGGHFIVDMLINGEYKLPIDAAGFTQDRSPNLSNPKVHLQ